MTKELKQVNALTKTYDLLLWIIPQLEKLPKSRIYKTSDGVDSLGYRIYPDYLRVRKSVVKRYRKKL